jgi:hypothetical protein
MAKQNLIEMIAHPWATLRKIHGLDRRSVARLGSGKKDPLDKSDRNRGVSRMMEQQYTYSRAEVYGFFIEMDQDPQISAVLDAYAENVVQPDYEKGRAIWCEADNEEVIDIVSRCLLRINTEEIAFSLARSMCQFGDWFENNILSQEGVMSLRPYEPWDVARIDDGRLLGFCSAGRQGEPVEIATSTVPAHRVLHFRLLGRQRKEMYGNSLLWGSREAWRRLKMMEDQVLLQRLARRPDRLAILLDTGGMSMTESAEVVKEWEEKMYKEFSLNKQMQQYSSTRAIHAEQKDLILPLGTDSKTSIINLPAATGNDMLKDLDYFHNVLMDGLHMPRGYFGEDGGNFDGNQSLGRQNVRFAKTAMRIQRALLSELVRLCAIDMAYQGIDPTLAKNQFRLQMTPVSPFMELERAELMNVRMDLVDRMSRMGQDMTFDPKLWHSYILTRFAQFPKTFVKELMDAAERVQQQQQLQLQQQQMQQDQGVQPEQGQQEQMPPDQQLQQPVGTQKEQLQSIAAKLLADACLSAIGDSKAQQGASMKTLCEGINKEKETKVIPTNQIAASASGKAAAIDGCKKLLESLGPTRRRIFMLTQMLEEDQAEEASGTQTV